MKIVALSLLAFAMVIAGVGHAATPSNSDDASADSAPRGIVEEEIVVLASRLPVERTELGESVTVLDSKRIDEAGYQYGADLLRFVPGIAVSRTGGYGGDTQVRVRGAEANHVLVMIDGIDVADAGTAEFDFESLLSFDIDRIESLRGPASGLHGSNALAGAIEIQTRQPNPGLALDAEVEVGGESTRHGAISIGGGTERARGRLSYARRRSAFDLSANNDAPIGAEDDKSDSGTISGHFRFAVSDQIDLRVVGRRANRQTDTDGFSYSGPLEGLAVDDRSSLRAKTNTAGVVSEFRTADERSVSHVTWQSTWTANDGGFYGDKAQRQQWHLDTSYLWPMTGTMAQRSTVFLHYEKETYRDLYLSDASGSRKQDRQLLGFGIEHRLEVNAMLFLSGNVRRDQNDRFEDATTWSADMSWFLMGRAVRVHSSAGRAVTNPTFAEQFGFVFGQFTGNPHLDPESSLGWDIGVETTVLDKALTFDATYFAASLTGEIESQFMTVANSHDESDRHGLELSLRYLPHDKISVYGAFTWTAAKDASGEKEVRRPKYSGSLSVARRYAGDRGGISAGVVYTGKQFDNDFRNFSTNGSAEKVALDRYLLFNVVTTFRISERYEVFARMENVLNDTYQEVFSYASPGRTFFTGMRVSLTR